MIKLFTKKINTQPILFFDLDDTLVNTYNFMVNVRNFAFDAMNKQGLNCDTEILWKHFWDVYKEVGANSNYHYDLLLKKLEITDEDIFKFKNIAHQAHIQYRDENFSKYMETLTPKILENLKKKKITLGLISAGIKEKQLEKLEMLKIKHYFQEDLIFISEEKNPQLYFQIKAYCKKKYFCENLWMVGDREENDIIPANSAGFKTIRIKGEGKYRFDFHNTKADHSITQFENIMRINFEKEKEEETI